MHLEVEESVCERHLPLSGARPARQLRAQPHVVDAHAAQRLLHFLRTRRLLRGLQGEGYKEGGIDRREEGGAMVRNEKAFSTFSARAVS